MLPSLIAETPLGFKYKLQVEIFATKMLQVIGSMLGSLVLLCNEKFLLRILRRHAEVLRIVLRQFVEAKVKASRFVTRLH